ncbi:hypothetical protein OEZ85_012940 [Tetradesmus obliquus]|uniref:Apple domain-containing protein n=1 Tax=Tetradesmus obliquus TaxID=3088 RepID=A0ABY8U4C9_TETOB|nr:hypothetical protein OEZ85_012940 [Tetradesmus obliquus]
MVLVLDVGSLHAPEPATPGTEAAAAAAANPEATAAAGLYIKSVQECSLHCALLPGCNAFSYCSTTTGCGAGCAEWAAQHPPVNATGGVKGDASSYWVQLPITGFGPFLPKGSSGCHPSGGWPYGMCSLAAVEDPADADILAQGAAGAGWVSGVFTLPPACTGSSARACESCAGGANVTGCLACVNSTQQDAASLAIRGVPNLRQPQDGCRSCYNSRAPDACMACLANDTLPCHRCPAEAVAPTADMDACIPCVRQRGIALASSCISCAQSSQPQQCTACLASAAKNFCENRPESGNPSQPFNVSAAGDDEPGSGQCIGVTSPICRLCVERSNQRDM